MPADEFTPGPWEIHVRPHGNVPMIVSGNPDDLAVCTVTDHGGMPWKANARLIAAAPALLDGLESALPFLNLLAAKMNYPPEVVCAVATVRSAITKATGR